MDANTARRLLEGEQTRLRDTREAARHLAADAAVSEHGELPQADQHPTDAATEVGEREKHHAVLLQLDGEVAELQAAFERLEAGRYGTCEACAKPIPDERLEAVPTARYCVGDQARRAAGL